jgi:predicted small metal-binding protein
MCLGSLHSAPVFGTAYKVRRGFWGIYLYDNHPVVIRAMRTMNLCTGHEPGAAGLPGSRRVPMTVCICRDLGMDCSFEATGSTQGELMRTFIDHAESAHHMHVLSADVLYRVQKAIRKLKNR